MNIKKLSTLFLIIVIFLQIIFYIIISSKNEQNLEKNLLSYLTDNLDTEISIKKLKISSNPIPKIYISNITTDKGMEFQDIEIYLDISQLIFGKLEIRKIYIENLILNQHDYDISKKDIYKLFSNILNLGQKFHDIRIKTVQPNLRDIKYLEKIKLSSHDKIISLSGKIKDDGNIKIIAEQKGDLLIARSEITTEFLKLNLVDNFQKNGLMTGNFSAEIVDVKKFSDFISKITDFNLLNFTHCNLSASGDFSQNEEHAVFKNLKLQSHWIDLIMDYRHNFKKEINDEISMLIKNVKLDDICKDNFFFDFMNNFKEFRVNFASKIENLSINNIDFSNILISGFSEIDKIKFYHFFGNIENKGKFAFEGELNKITDFYEFNGATEIQVPNLYSILNKVQLKEANITKNIEFKIISDVIFRKNIYSFKNSQIKLGENKYEANFAFDFTSNKNLLLGNLQSDAVEISEENFPYYLKSKSYLEKLVNNSMDVNYLSYFIPFRTVNFNTELDVNLKNVRYSSYKFDSIKFISKFSPGFFLSENFTIENGPSFVNGRLQLLANSIIPSIDLIIKDGKIITDYASFANFNHNIKSWIDNLKLSNLVSKMQVSIPYIEINSLPITDFSFYSNSTNNEINFTNIKAKIFDGDVLLSGYIPPLNDDAVFSYNISSINFSKMLDYFLPNIFPFTRGLISIAGNLSFKGNDLQNFVYNLDLQGDFAGAGLKIKNLGLNELASHLAKNKMSIDDLNNKYNLFRNNIESSISNFSGKINYAKGLLNLNNGEFSLVEKNSKGNFRSNINIYDLSLYLNSNIFIESNNEKNYKINIISKGNIISPEKKFIVQ